MSVTTEQVRKVMKISAYARRITTFFLACVLAAFSVGMLSLLFGWPASTFKFSISTYVFSHETLRATPVKIWVLAYLTLACALFASLVYLLRSVFANLARGEIFCPANVRIIRNMGWLMIMTGALGLLTPFANATFFMFAGHQGIEHKEAVFLTDVFDPFAYGGMLILLSWIMAVGLGVREDADELRRDAELVI